MFWEVCKHVMLLLNCSLQNLKVTWFLKVLFGLFWYPRRIRKTFFLFFPKLECGIFFLEIWFEKQSVESVRPCKRMPPSRALKWAPTWYVWADTSNFTSYPDLIQRLAIKGIWDVSPDLSSGGSFQSSQWACSHGTLQNPWEVFSISTVSAALCRAIG